ncbi:MAG: ATP-binding protein [Leptospirales bacterium]|nr:ATP-binding protein [Leptospirales bacterium]
MNKRKLPIGGVQTFSTVRKEYDVYVDKTMFIYNMATRYRSVFLARPRRFGKSLLCSTISSLFRNQKEYFEDLAISKTDWQWKEHPVIHLSLGAGNFTDNGIDVLKLQLNSQLKDCAKMYDVAIDAKEDISVNFRQLIVELFREKGEVIVIIDEYDNPLLSTIDQKELNEKLREELKGFYSVIKQEESYLRFAFITGVTKFAQISLFLGMNQPNDISMMPEYCGICGITQEELEENFVPEIEDYAPKYGGRENYLRKMKEYYDGYCFTEKKLSVYNTYGLLNHFDKSAKFIPYWSMSGTPSFLLKYLEMKEVDIVDIEEAQMEADNFGDYRDSSITLFPLLYQAGYLTISDYDERTGFYKLSYPNIEVRKTLAGFLSNHYSKAETKLKKSVSVRLVDSLLDGKPDDFMNLLKIYLQRVDYSLSSKITEYYFEFAVSNIINMLGLMCFNEVHSANGRMDSVIFAGDYIYILEFKADKPVEDALWQIEEKDYASIYADSRKKIVKVGIAFSKELRNIVDWKIG